MSVYSINKGIGKSTEFKGLRSGYLFLFASGLLALFLLFVLLFLCGVPQSACLIFLVVAASTLVAITFRLNERYGEHGLMKVWARFFYPDYLINRIPVRKLTPCGPAKPKRNQG